MNTFDLSKAESYHAFFHQMRFNAQQLVQPIGGTFELTARCNFKCKMCYVRLDPSQVVKLGRELTAEEWISLAGQAADAGTLYLLLTGGEPFLRPDFRQIYEAISDMGFVLSVYSNTYLVDERQIEWFAKRPPAIFRATLYGASNETYHAVCGCHDGFDKVKNNLLAMKKAGINVTICTTFIKENKDDLNAIIDFVTEHNFPFSYTMNVYGQREGTCSNPKESRVDLDDFNSPNYSTQKRVEALFKVDDGPFGKCSSHGNAYWISWNGKMLFCSMLSRPTSNPLELGLVKSFIDLNQKLQAVKEPIECISCKYKAFCSGCPGTFYAETGFCDQTSGRICDIAKQKYDTLSINALEGG